MVGGDSSWGVEDPSACTAFLSSFQSPEEAIEGLLVATEQLRHATKSIAAAYVLPSTRTQPQQ